MSAQWRFHWADSAAIFAATLTEQIVAGQRSLRPKTSLRWHLFSPACAPLSSLDVGKLFHIHVIGRSIACMLKQTNQQLQPAPDQICHLHLRHAGSYRRDGLIV